MFSPSSTTLLSLLALLLRLVSASSSVATAPAPADAQPTAGPAAQTSHDLAAPTPAATATVAGTSFDATAVSTFATVTASPLVRRSRLAPVGPKETVYVKDRTEDPLWMIHGKWITIHQGQNSYMRPANNGGCRMM